MIKILSIYNIPYSYIFPRSIGKHQKLSWLFQKYNVVLFWFTVVKWRRSSSKTIAGIWNNGYKFSSCKRLYGKISPKIKVTTTGVLNRKLVATSIVIITNGENILIFTSLSHTKWCIQNNTVNHTFKFVGSWSYPNKHFFVILVYISLVLIITVSRKIFRMAELFEILFEFLITTFYSLSFENILPMFRIGSCSHT